MSLMPTVERLPLAMNPLATAVRDATLPDGFVATRPRGAQAWREHIAVCQQPLLGKAWATTLRDALRPSGAAAARLARVADGQGVVVTTGQQPGLFGGPMYTLVKALSALALANRIESLTGVATAPVFWAATDDADFQEGATTWLPTAGALIDVRLRHAPPDGTMMSNAPLHGVDDALQLLQRSAAGAAWPEAIRAAQSAYKDGVSIGDAYVELMRRLLTPLGIVVLDAAHPAVRKASSPVLRHALDQAEAIDRAVTERTAALRELGFTPQVELVENRALVFVVRHGVKERATVRGASSARDDAREDALSPNVLLRPIVERALLPTIAYLAGPGEMAYFAQVGAVASAMHIAIPLALPRTSLRIQPPDVRVTLATLGQTADAMRDTVALQRELATMATAEPALDALTSLRAQVRRTHESLRDAGGALPPAALDGAVAQVEHRVERLERRVLAASKRAITQQLERVAQVQGMLWPHGAPQERVVNPLPWLARFGTPLLDRLVEVCDEGASSLVND